MRFQLWSKWITVAALLMGLTACAGMMTHYEKPEVSIAGIDLVEPGLLEQRYRIQLRVHNPNDVDMPLDGISFSITLNGHEFVNGESSLDTKVPRFGSKLVDVDAVSTLAGFARQFGAITANPSLSARYVISGKIHLSHPATSLPFSQEGEVGVPGISSKQTTP